MSNMNVPVALLTDRYEYTMAAAALRSPLAHTQCTFEVFARSIAPNRSYLLFAGLNRLLEQIEQFTFEDATLSWMKQTGLDDELIDYLKGWKFKGTINAYKEGDVIFPNSPVLQVQATFVDAVLLETLILSILNFDTAVATSAARMRSAAKGATLIEMGSRRTHEHAALAAARAAYIAGFDSTSNMAAGYIYNIPTAGTAAHAFTLAHETELEAFQAQVEYAGQNTTLLVDTYDIAQGIRNAIAAAPKLGAIRIDSGDLSEVIPQARELLDNLGAQDTRIVCSSDMDEYKIKEVADLPVDGFGVGTRLVTAPSVGFVYKLVEIQTTDGPRAVAKKSSGKPSYGYRKNVERTYENTKLISETIKPAAGTPTTLDVVFENGKRTLNPSIEEIKKHASASLASLTACALEIVGVDEELDTAVETRIEIINQEEKK